MKPLKQYRVRKINFSGGITPLKKLFFLSPYSDVPASAPSAASPACPASTAAAAAGAGSVSGSGLKRLHAPAAKLSVWYDGNGQPTQCPATAPAKDATATHPA